MFQKRSRSQNHEPAEKPAAKKPKTKGTSTSTSKKGTTKNTSKNTSNGTAKISKTTATKKTNSAPATISSPGKQWMNTDRYSKASDTDDPTQDHICHATHLGVGPFRSSQLKEWDDRWTSYFSQKYLSNPTNVHAVRQCSNCGNKIVNKKGKQCKPGEISLYNKIYLCPRAELSWHKCSFCLCASCKDKRSVNSPPQKRPRAQRKLTDM